MWFMPETIVYHINQMDRTDELDNIMISAYQ